MIALVNDKNSEVISPLTRQCLPIVQRSEKTMQNNERVALPEGFIIEFHKAKVWLPDETIVNTTMQPVQKPGHIS